MMKPTGIHQGYLIFQGKNNFKLQICKSYHLSYNIFETIKMYKSRMENNYCRNLGEEIFFSNEASQWKHESRMIPPHQLVPKTYPNNLSKVGCSKVLNLQDNTQQSSLAIRSILPEELPSHSQDPRRINIIASPNELADDRPIKIGSNKIKVWHQKQDLSLNSNIIGTDLQRQNVEQQDIEKQIYLKPIKANIVKKQVYKLQSNNMAPRQMADLGRREAKVQNTPLKQQKVGATNYFDKTNSTDDDNVYQIQEVNKSSMWSALVGIVKQQNQPISVNFSRKTGPANVFSSIQTKSNAHQKATKRGTYYPEDNQTKVGKINDQESEDSLKLGQGQHVPLRQNQCPSCHGFYCPHCKSTVPPKYRPFWDQNEDPKLIQYYTKLQEQSTKKLCHKNNE